MICEVIFIWSITAYKGSNSSQADHKLKLEEMGLHSLPLLLSFSLWLCSFKIILIQVHKISVEKKLCKLLRVWCDYRFILVLKHCWIHKTIFTGFQFLNSIPGSCLVKWLWGLLTRHWFEGPCSLHEFDGSRATQKMYWKHVSLLGWKGVWGIYRPGGRNCRIMRITFTDRKCSVSKALWFPSGGLHLAGLLPWKDEHWHLVSHISSDDPSTSNQPQ